MTIKEIMFYGQNILKESGIDDYVNDTKVLAMYAFGLNYTDILVNMNEHISDEKIKDFKKYINLRSTHMPCQYIVGSQEFMGYEFLTKEGVLIPRQETEILVEKSLELTKNIDACKALDMCSGSGCIGISFEKKRFEKGHKNDIINLVDISDEAIELSNLNKEKLGSGCEIIKSDLFDKVNQKYDIIMSNPPYIKTADILNLMDEVKNYEPRLALDGEDDGLYFYRKISNAAPNYLKPNGILIFEIGYDQFEDVKKILMDNNFFNINKIKDYSGLDRVVIAYASEPGY